MMRKFQHIEYAQRNTTYRFGVRTTRLEIETQEQHRDHRGAGVKL